MKFESLSLGKYEFARIQRTMQLKGGVLPDSSQIPTGGSSTSTGGGRQTTPNGETLTWTADKDVFDSTGVLIFESADRENLCVE